MLFYFDSVLKLAMTPHSKVQPEKWAGLLHIRESGWVSAGFLAATVIMLPHNKNNIANPP